ncbi:hypothetical protein HOP50_01g09980 [Chloropicon primus]|nr:hypothetical protein HOP50_01g09980 [Chloropicon primus]
MFTPTHHARPEHDRERTQQRSTAGASTSAYTTPFRDDRAKGWGGGSQAKLNTMGTPARGSMSPATPRGEESRAGGGGERGSTESRAKAQRQGGALGGGSPLSLDDLRTWILGACKSQTRSVYSGLSGTVMGIGKVASSASSTSKGGVSGSMSSTPSTGIAKACVGVETWLNQNCDDHRAFFDNIFRLLLQEVFGLGKPKGKSWLYLVSLSRSTSSSSSHNSDARHLRRLLDPSGVLMTAVIEADERSLYPHGFTFPIETLPAVAGVARTQSLLRQGQEKLVAALPHYRGRLQQTIAGEGGSSGSFAGSGKVGRTGGHASSYGTKTEVRLSLWEYFVSWLVFYAIQEPGSGSGTSSGAYSTQRTPMANLNDLSNLSWNAFTGTAKELFSGSSSPKQTKTSTAVYKDLLDAYIKAYIRFQAPSGPRAFGEMHGLGPMGMSSPNSAAKAVPSTGPLARYSAAKRQFMLDVMMEFWLSDVNQVEATSMRTISFVCPSQDLITSIKQLVKHLVRCTTAVKGGSTGSSMSAGSPSLTLLSGGSASQGSMSMSRLGSPTSSVSHSTESVKQETYVVLWNTKRALYRFLLRCFALWPSEQSVSLKPVIDLWATYVAPWEAVQRKRVARAEKNQPMSIIRRTVSLTKGKKPPETPNGSSPTKSEQWSDWKEHILSNMPFYTILVQYFVNLQYARATARPESAISDLLIMLDALLSGGRLGSFLKETEQDLHMHALGSLTGSKYFEKFSLIRHDYHELHKYALQGLPSSCSLGDQVPLDVLHTKESMIMVQLQQVIDVLSISRKMSSSRLEELARLCTRVFGFEFKFVKPGNQRRTPKEKKSKVQIYRSFTWHDVVAFQKRYKGDWMKRPVSSYEIEPLVRLWVGISERANVTLGLDAHQGADWLHNSENLALQLASSLVQWCKSKNMRVDLRFLSGWFPTVALALYFASWFLVTGWWPLVLLVVCLLTQM